MAKRLGLAIAASAAAVLLTVAGTGAAVAQTSSTEVPVEPPDTLEQSETTVAPTTTEADGDGGGFDEGLSAGTVVLLVVGGLMLVALALSVLTWRYWRATSPRRRSAPTI